MMFFLRAAFWLAIVSVFVPSEFASNALDMSFDTSTTRIDANAAVGDWCADRTVLCETGAEAANFGGLLADFAINRLETALAERQAGTS